jgi:hypothetical protein
MAIHDEDVPATDEEIVHIRGAGGHIWPMALPLHEAIADQVAKGESVRVNEDGSPWEPSEDDPELVLESERDRLEREHLAGLEYAQLKRERPDEDPLVLRDEAAEIHDDPIPEDAPQVDDKPKVAQPKADWVAYAGSVSDLSRLEAEAMTKAQLVERFG